MLIENLPLEEDQNPPRFHDILGMAVYTTPLPGQRGFYVDEVALASERKSLFTDSVSFIAIVQISAINDNADKKLFRTCNS